LDKCGAKRCVGPGSGRAATVQLPVQTLSGFLRSFWSRRHLPILAADSCTRLFDAKLFVKAKEIVTEGFELMGSPVESVESLPNVAAK
jgi:hypothetical protein